MENAACRLESTIGSMHDSGIVYREYITLDLRSVQDGEGHGRQAHLDKTPSHRRPCAIQGHHRAVCDARLHLQSSFGSPALQPQERQTRSKRLNWHVQAL